MSYLAAKETVFRAGHYLRMASVTEEPHEHEWKVRAVVEASNLDSYDLVMDFGHLERLMAESAAPLSEVGMTNELGYFEGRNPSTERLAEYIYARLAERLPAGVKLLRVRVWETADSWAEYRG